MSAVAPPASSDDRWYQFQELASHMGGREIAEEMVTSAAQDFMELVAHTNLWMVGDGEGGWVYRILREASINAGLPLPTSGHRTAKDRERARVSTNVRRRVMERDEYRCRKCGDHRSLEVDHIIALKDGGTSDDDNLQTLCKPCHREKTSGRS